jgi:hypothetical protein
MLCITFLLISWGAPATSQNLTIEGELHPTEGCFLPRIYDPAVPYSGFTAWVREPLATILAEFPAQWDGKPRIGVALGVRPPGLSLSFPHAIDVLWGFASTNNRLTFNPPEVISPNPPTGIDTIRVMWEPLEPFDSGWTSFDAHCDFAIAVSSYVPVTADIAVNLLGIYAAPGDTIQVWGTDVGLPDLTLTGTRESIPWNVVEPATWGFLKSYYR